MENFNTLPSDTFEKEQLELDQIVENMVPIARLDEIEEINVEILDYEEIITTQVADETTTLVGNIEEIEYIDDQSLNSIIINQESVLPKETQLCQGDFNIVQTNTRGVDYYSKFLRSVHKEANNHIPKFQHSNLF